MQEEVQGLLEKFVNDKGTGLFQTMKEPMYDQKRKFINTKTQYPVEMVAALYNYKFVLEDRRNGVHNTSYAVQILHGASPPVCLRCECLWAVPRGEFRTIQQEPARQNLCANGHSRLRNLS